LRSGLAGYGLRAARDVLARYTPGNPESDAERAPDGFRFHFEFDGNSGGADYSFWVNRRGCRLLSGGVGSKV
jgi:hypothetical protein